MTSSIPHAPARPDHGTDPRRPCWPGPRHRGSQRPETSLIDLMELMQPGRSSRETTLGELIAWHGVEVVPERNLEDAEVEGRLRELTEALAMVGCSLEGVEHLTPRELYGAIQRRVLRWQVQMPSRGWRLRGRLVFDFSGIRSMKGIPPVP